MPILLRYDQLRAPRAFMPTQLVGQVRVFWSVGSDAAPPQRSLPDGSVDLVFHFDPIGDLAAAAVIGVMSRPREIPPQRGDRIGVTLAPGEALAFLGVPVSEVKDQVINLEELWGLDARTLFDRMKALPSNRARIGELEHALALRCRRSTGTAQLRRVRAAIDCLSRRRTPSIEAVAREIGTSPRHLERLFREHVGLTPKTLARIQRFNRLLRQLEGNTPTSWSNLAYEHDFSDQAHLIREFRALTGDAPARFFRANTSHSLRW